MHDIYLIFLLLVAFELKHFVADYAIQMANSRYYNRKFHLTHWQKPLADHCFSHFCGTLFISIIVVGWYKPDLMLFGFLLCFIFASIDFSLHFIIDRIKSSPSMWGKYLSQSDYRYWLAMGADQLLHRLTNFLIIGLIWTSLVL